MQRLVCPRLLMALPVGATAAAPTDDKPHYFADDECGDNGGATSESDVDVDVERAADDVDDEDAIMDLSRRGLSEDDDDVGDGGARGCTQPPAACSSGRLAFSVENILDPTKFTGRALCWKPLGAPDDDLSGSDLGKHQSTS
jgi:hypothetical protein